MRPISTFSCYFQSLLAYIGLVSTSMDYLCIPHTIVYLSDVFPTFSDLSQSLFIFTLIDVPMFWLFFIVDDSDVTIPSDSDPYGLLVISESSDTISTPLMLLLLVPYLLLPFKQRNTSPFIPETS